MNLYEVFNDYMGESATHVLVMASSAERACSIASEKFEAPAQERERQVPGQGYPEGYWLEANLRVVELYISPGDHAPEWVSDPR